MTRWIKRIFIAILAVVVLTFIGIIGLLTLEDKHWHDNYIVAVHDKIPAKIKIEKILADDYEQSLPGGWCDGLTFKISDQSLQEIRKQGLAFFKDIEPLEPVKIRGSDSYWTKWKEKPNSLPDGDAQMPYGCLTEFEKFKKKNSYAVRRDTKVYYTYVKHRGYSNISVYPEWGIVIYASWAN